MIYYLLNRYHFQLMTNSNLKRCHFSRQLVLRVSLVRFLSFLNKLHSLVDVM